MILLQGELPGVDCVSLPAAVLERFDLRADLTEIGVGLPFRLSAQPVSCR